MKMKNISKLFLSLGVIAIAFVGCQDYVESVDEPINVITDGILTNEAQIPFVTTGVYGRMSVTHDLLTVGMALLSDQFIFDDQVNNATFPTYRQIDTGDIVTDNNTSDGITNQINQARFFADNLIERVNEIGEFEDATVRAAALYAGNLVGGLTRYWLGASFGLTETSGGAPIDNSAVISTSDLWADAITRLTAARDFASTPAETKLVNSLIGKIHLYSGNYSAASTALAAGMVEGDAPFQSLHNAESGNEWHFAGGRGRTQIVASPRFVDIVANDPNELSRVAIEVADPGGSWTGADFYQQALYTNTSASINIMTWQEVALMLAECTVRGVASGDALTLVNDVRASHGIAALAGPIDIATIMAERDKELFTLENRAIDQRREPSLGWHITQGGTYSTPSISYTINWTPWQFLPISSRERNNNPNVPQ